MGYNDDATLALRLCGAVCLIRSCMYTIYPDTLTSIIGYPPAPAAAGGWGKKAGIGPSEDDVQSVMVCVQFYGLVQGGLAGVCLATARIGHEYTMSVVSTVLGALFLALCAFATSMIGTEGLKYVSAGDVNKVIAPLALLAAYMLYVGVSGVRKGAPAGEPIGQSGKMMAVVSVLAILQALVPIFFVEKHFATYGMAIAHPSSEGTAKLMITMWGMCIAAGGIARLGVIYAGHTDSIYANCRAFVIYMSEMCGVMVMVSVSRDFDPNPNPKSNRKSNPSPRPNPNANQLKTLGKADDKAMGTMCLVLTFYTFLLYFGGTIADDSAAAKSAKGKKKK